MATFITSFSDGDTQTNLPIVLTLPATFGVTHVLTYLTASYGFGGAGYVYVEINGIEVFRSDASNGANFSGQLFGNPGDSLEVFLDAGGPFIDGTVRIVGRED